MSDTIVEEQEPEVAEGHQFLLKGDLDLDAQENIPAEDKAEKPPKEDKAEKPPEKDKVSTPEAEVEAKPEEAPPEEDKGVEPREIKGIKVGENVFSDVESLASEHLNLRSVLGRQGDHIGELKTRITELEGQVPRSDGADDQEPEYDALDKEKVDTWNAWNTRRIKREIASEQAAAEADKQQQAAITAAQAAQDETQAFLESHPELSVKQLLEVTRLRGERGISYEKALSEVGNSQPEKEPDKETKPIDSKPPETDKTKEEPDEAARKKQEEAEKGGKNLSEGGGAAKAEVDLDSLTPQEWGEKKKDMTQAEIDAHLAGEDLE